MNATEQPPYRVCKQRDKDSWILAMLLPNATWMLSLPFVIDSRTIFGFYYSILFCSLDSMYFAISRIYGYCYWSCAINIFNALPILLGLIILRVYFPERPWWSDNISYLFMVADAGYISVYILLNMSARYQHRKYTIPTTFLYNPKVNSVICPLPPSCTILQTFLKSYQIISRYGSNELIKKNCLV